LRGVQDGGLGSGAAAQLGLEVFEVFEKRHGGLVAFGRVFVQGLQDDALHLRMHGTTGLLGGRRWRIIDVSGEDGARGFGLEGYCAGDELVQDDAHGVEVGATVELFGLSLFWRQVLGRTVHDAGLRQLGLIPARIFDLGDAEVEYLYELVDAAKFGDHNVVRLQVAVNNAQLMG
jgi:hypothetical protein